MRRSLVQVLCALLLAIAAVPANAIFDPSTPGYDLDGKGVPKFVNSVYIELNRVSQISKFRSNAGHNYSDHTQFGLQAIKGTDNRDEDCRSMKHYFIAPDALTEVRAPVSGRVSGITGEAPLGDQISFVSDEYPAFEFTVFHVVLDAALTIGQHVNEGERLGHHTGTETYSDLAVVVKTTRGFHLVSYFETLTDTAFAAFQARGVTTRESLIYTKAQRDAAPFTCGGPISFNTNAAADYITMTGGLKSQTVTVPAPPTFVRLSEKTFALGATASSGLPVTLQSRTPKVCTPSGASLSLLAPGPCTVTATQEGTADYGSAQQVANFVVVAGLNAGPVYASSQADLASHLRFYNSGTQSGTVTATVYDAETSESLGQWTSPAIPGGSEQQFSIATVEKALTLGTAKRNFYALVLNAGFAGTFQHVLFRQTAGVLSNLTACGYGNGSNPLVVSGVHSSQIGGFGYPSSIIVRPVGSVPAPVTLGIYDAATGAKLGTYTTAEIPVDAALKLDMATLESGANIPPTARVGHYVVKAEAIVGGFLQHIVTNEKSGVITDLTRQCMLDGSAQIGGFGGGTHVSLAYGSAGGSTQSYLRIYNAFTAAGTVTVTMSDFASGKMLGKWTSPSIGRGSQQFAMSTLEAALDPGLAKPALYTLKLESTISTGYVQHVLYNVAAGTLTNLSACSTGLGADRLGAFAVHSSLIAANPSTIVLNNPGIDPVVWGTSTSAGWAFLLQDARNNTVLGGSGDYSRSGTTMPNVPAYGALRLDIPSLENSIQRSPTAGLYHYTYADAAARQGTGSNQAGYLQHLVTNQQTGVIDDMTYACFLR